jgi:sugar O-acyltransferase (sialic acid O-acetyltransferase NeuD family)
VENRLLIIGAGGHGKVVADVAMKMNTWKSIQFLDDNQELKRVLGLEVIGKVEDALKYVHDYQFIVAIGDNSLRERIQLNLTMAQAKLALLVHPDAIIGKQVEIGKGTVVMAGVIINSCTHVGSGCIINTGSIIEHDNIIEDYVHVSPGVITGGTVRIGKGTWLGLGSKIINNVSIAGDCIVGAGAVVIEDIINRGLYVGIPAKKVDRC